MKVDEEDTREIEAESTAKVEGPVEDGKDTDSTDVDTAVELEMKLNELVGQALLASLHIPDDASSRARYYGTHII